MVRRKGKEDKDEKEEEGGGSGNGWYIDGCCPGGIKRVRLGQTPPERCPWWESLPGPLRPYFSHHLSALGGANSLRSRHVCPGVQQIMMNLAIHNSKPAVCPPASFCLGPR